MVSNERPVALQVQQRPQLHQMQSAVNKAPSAYLGNQKKAVVTEDQLLNSLENLDMLLANMKLGDV